MEFIFQNAIFRQKDMNIYLEKVLYWDRPHFFQGININFM